LAAVSGIVEYVVGLLRKAICRCGPILSWVEVL
jgi:hypothetical protein